MLIYLIALTHVYLKITLKSDIGCQLDLKSTVNDTKHQIVKKCHLSAVQKEDDPERCTVNQDPTLTDIANDPSPCFSIHDNKYENSNLDVPNPMVGDPKTTGDDLPVDGPMPVPLLTVMSTFHYLPNMHQMTM